LILRALHERRERLAWSFLALGIVLSAFGDLYWDVSLAQLSAIPSPSAADWLYLSFYPAAYVGLALLLRARRGRFPASVWLDGAIGALGISALVGAFAFPTVIDTTGGEAMTVATNIAYPIGDVAMLGMIVCVVGMMGWRPGRAWLLLAAGMVLWSVADTVSLYQTAGGSYVAGTWLDLCWPAALILIATASCQRARRVQRATFIGWPTLAVPAGFGLAALGLAVFDHFRRIDTAALLLSGAAMALVIGRLALTFTEYMRAFTLSRQEAVSDPLTGLSNRRALTLDLEDALAHADERSAVILFDLDGFKSYNDTFEQPAGDALLEQIAGALTQADHGGRVYRMGGDEFCVLAPLGGRDAHAIARSAADALVVRGELFEITASYGVVVIPDETASLTDAMRLADQRLYVHKGAGRRSQTGHAIDTLVRVMAERGSGLGEHGNEVADLASALGAHIVALCDAYHAMITTRSYRASTTHEAAVAELRRCAGTQFDPALVEPFIRLLERQQQGIAA
jgi:two-component system, cell cycle response regulator